MNACRIPDASVLTGWRKSSYSGSENQDCIEVAHAEDRVATRDSKNPTGPALSFTREAWVAFLGGVEAGDFGDV
ncbi:DUF397 domain-containing protein [Streptomyces sp. NBC_00448]|uniref:DUF397 domain-containing protein n=1 Tax=Streptomyces sp. NBC_00448 TaxID=2903652 RepID=UPI002E1B74D0